MAQLVDNWKKTDKCKEYYRQRYLQRKDNPEYIKGHKINRWKRCGLLSDCDEVYEKYLSTTNWRIN